MLSSLFKKVRLLNDVFHCIYTLDYKDLNIFSLHEYQVIFHFCFVMGDFYVNKV